MQPKMIRIALDGREVAALQRAAQHELRRPNDQARMMLRQALGLTQAIENQSTNANRDSVGVGAERVAVA